MELADETSQLKASLAEAGDSVRTNLIKVVASGAGIKATAKAMGVSYQEANRWLEVWSRTGAVAQRRALDLAQSGTEQIIRQNEIGRKRIGLPLRIERTVRKVTDVPSAAKQHPALVMMPMPQNSRLTS